METLTLDPDRLFPVDPSAREVARELYDTIKDLPIISPHGHVEPGLLLDNAAFPNASELFLRYDHYVFRLLNSAGIDLNEIGVGKVAMSNPREAWRIFCQNWHLFDGTASGYWLTHEFVTLFNIDQEPSADNADQIYDQIGTRLREEDFRPRALFNSFPIAFLATTDDPLDSLDEHAELAKLTRQGELGGRVVPTWRPDAYVDARKPEFVEKVAALTASVGGAPDSLSDYLQAMQESRRRFIEHGAVSADFGAAQPAALDLAATLTRNQNLK